MTTYIKRVPQFKAVQFFLSKEFAMQLREILGYQWSWAITGGSDARVRIEIDNGKPNDSGRIAYKAEQGDWIVVEEGQLPCVMTDDDFKAQYEAASEGKELYSWDPSDFLEPTALLRIMGVPTGTDVPVNWEPLGCGMYLVKVKP